MNYTQIIGKRSLSIKQTTLITDYIIRRFPYVKDIKLGSSGISLVISFSDSVLSNINCEFLNTINTFVKKYIVSEEKNFYSFSDHNAEFFQLKITFQVSFYDEKQQPNFMRVLASHRLSGFAMTENRGCKYLEPENRGSKYLELYTDRMELQEIYDLHRELSLSNAVILGDGFTVQKISHEHVYTINQEDLL